MNLVLRAAGLAAISGLRSMSGPALLGQTIRRGGLENLRDTYFGVLGSRELSSVLLALMVGEMVADKTPFIPSRTSLPALLGRAVSGVLVGVATFCNGEDRVAVGGALGITAAVVTAYAGQALRMAGTQSLGVPNSLVGLLEDTLVVVLGVLLLRDSS